ncbi:hypothetical protein SteCoe_30190 [Stentor coeruleus]|uniref:Myb-like DNA-binding domain containing protein n=1 Tax=Stentor coeruleus TaxID=5963 RepID=A0A1R2B450_9CILI|nr:hypothetical protein SteCoe_30190 [Stentor coeruleus]
MDITNYLRQQFKLSTNQQYHIEGDIWLVPCVANYGLNEYKPLIKPLSSTSCNDQQDDKQGWNSIEDEILLKIVSSRGAKAWSAIAKELNTMIHEGLQVRQGRHCRERWYNHVDPSLVKGLWKEEEDDFIINQQIIMGNKWSEIARKMQGRTENSVKNRFKSLMRKQKSGKLKKYILKNKNIEESTEKIKNGTQTANNYISIGSFSNFPCLNTNLPNYFRTFITPQHETANFNTFKLLNAEEIEQIKNKLFYYANYFRTFITPQHETANFNTFKLPNAEEIEQIKNKLFYYV